MKKKLRIEELSVDSFEVSGRNAGPRGTVRAHDNTNPPNCFSGVPSCLGTCEDTCGLTCWQSCFQTQCSCDETCNCA